MKLSASKLRGFRVSLSPASAPVLLVPLRLLFEDDLDEELELPVEELALVGGGDVVLPDFVDLGLHLEVLLLDVQPVPLVQLLQHLRALQGNHCDRLVYLRDLPLENNLYLLQLTQECLQLTLFLLSAKKGSRDCAQEGLSARIGVEVGITVGYKVIECTTWFHKADLTCEAKTTYIVSKHYFAEGSCERHSCNIHQLVLATQLRLLQK